MLNVRDAPIYKLSSKPDNRYSDMRDDSKLDLPKKELPSNDFYKIFPLWSVQFYLKFLVFVLFYWNLNKLFFLIKFHFLLFHKISSESETELYFIETSDFETGEMNWKGFNIGKLSIENEFLFLISVIYHKKNIIFLL